LTDVARAQGRGADLGAAVIGRSFQRASFTRSDGARRAALKRMTEDMQTSQIGRQLWTGIFALAVASACIGLLIFMLWPQ